MSLYVSGISLPFTSPGEEALDAARKRLGNPPGARYSLARRAVDARKRRDIRFVYTVVVQTDGEEELLARFGGSQVIRKQQEPLETPKGSAPLQNPPVVVGLGPAGLFAALLLARTGYRPTVLERGGDMDARVEAVERFWREGKLDPDTNVQFGEGGAGTFSDGKLTTRIGDSRCGFVLEELCRHGAPPEIRFQAKPHIGTDRLREVVKSIRREIVRLGGAVHFHTCLDGLSLHGGGVHSLSTQAGALPAQAVILAPGHSARELYTILQQQGVALEQKPFSVGVRVEHLQEEIDRAQYGDAAGHPLLPKGEYQLSWRQGTRGVYTFCMCPGGVVVPAASQEGMAVTNGMSWSTRDGRNANAAVAVSVDSRDFGSGVLDGAAFQQRLEAAAFRQGGGGYRAPSQTVGRFLKGEQGFDLGRVQPTYQRGIAPGDFDALFPEPVTRMLREGLERFGRKLAGFDAGDALLTGVETRTSSPVRIPRNIMGEAVGIRGLYPCGEGAGYAGGIMSAAVDGIRAAQALIAAYAPPR